jgi:hypothetical protein
MFIVIIEYRVEIEGFNIDLYFRMGEKMIVLEGEKIGVSLLDGTEVECVIE